ncbi:MAG: DUF4157 domain-containing protein [Oscillospiraceae bacterium]|nr:DUF4157 domain-containing protein [Oscillospiraceae bacterium]
MRAKINERFGAGAENRTGIPDKLKWKYEEASGFSFDDVRVHYNSDKPDALQALAYTMGNDVHIAPGQERHLPHELGHVVQQKSGLVTPTTRVNGIPVNDSAALERAADSGAAALGSANTAQRAAVMQRYVKKSEYTIGAAPADAANADDRRVAVNDSEPSTLYIRSDRVPADIPAEFEKLGIDVTRGSQTIGDSDFYVFGQKNPTNYEDIAADDPFMRNSEKLRTESEKSSASEIYILQKNEIKTIKDCGKVFFDCVTGCAGLELPVCKERFAVKIPYILRQTKDFISEYYVKQREIAMFDLGTDIIETAFAIEEAAKGLQRANIKQEDIDDCKNLLEIIIPDIEFREKQIENEINLIDIKPQLQTGCDTSARDRKYIAGSDIMHADIPENESGDFENRIGWSYHFASKIKAADLTMDSLFIEDAVGKSARAEITANAHWFAKIYGKMENGSDEENKTYLKDKMTGNSEFESDNHFNKLSAKARKEFFEIPYDNQKVVKPNKINGWNILYKDLSEGQKLKDSVKIYRNGDDKIIYKFISEAGQNAAERHFLITTADAIVDSFVVRYFSRKDQRREAEINRILKKGNRIDVKDSQSFAFPIEDAVL